MTMNNLYRILASVQLDENDRRALIIMIVVLVLLLLVLGLIGMGLRKLMQVQAKRVHSMMYHLVTTRVVDTPAKFRRIAFKKSNRILFKQTLIPVLIALGAFLIWLVSNLFLQRWGANIFADMSDLFFQYDWVGTPEDPVFVKIFGMSMIARFPDVSHSPEFIGEHAPSYIVVFLYIVSWVWVAVACLGYISRFLKTMSLSHEVFTKSLDGYHAGEDLQITPDHPLPPSD